MAKPIPAVDPVTSAFFHPIVSSYGQFFSLFRFVHGVSSAQVINGETVIRPANQQQIINGRVNHLYPECVPVAAQSGAEDERNYQQSAAHQGKAPPQPKRQQQANECLRKWKNERKEADYLRRQWRLRECLHKTTCERGELWQAHQSMYQDIDAQRQSQDAVGKLPV
jgi:hypothetical protein